MDNITIIYTPSQSETVSGIPEYVEITASGPATIYYTLDGTLPTPLSPQYFEQIWMPGDLGTVVLNSIAYFLDGYNNLVPSSVLSVEYSTDHSDLASHIRRNFTGVFYMYPGGLDLPYWYDSNGDAKIFIDIPIEDFEGQLVVSERNSDGTARVDIEGGVVRSLTDKHTPSTADDDTVEYSTPSDLDNFNPRARHIVMDGRNRSPDEISMTNGPHMMLNDPSDNYARELRRPADEHHRSSGMTRPLYNRNTETIVFNYFDTVSGRSIKSIQRLPPIGPPPRNTVIGGPMFFAWFKWGRKQNL